MKIKDVQKMRDENVGELRVKAQKLKEEIARMQVEGMINRPKNTNAISHKKKELAILLTVIGEKK